MTNSNNKLIFVLPLIIILGAVVGLMTLNKTSTTPKVETTDQKPIEATPTNESTEANSAMNEEESKSATLEEFSAIIASDVPETALKYVLTSKSNASYTVAKTFFEKPGITVTGVTDGVVGAAWYDEASKRYYLKANIDLTKLRSDSEKRDADIMPLFTPPAASFELIGDNTDDKLSLTEPFETQIAGNLTVGEVTKEVMFDVKGSLSKTSFAAEGMTKTKMSNFDITAPSLFEVFSVADDIDLKFVVDAVAVN